MKKFGILLITLALSLSVHAYIETRTIDNISYDINTESKTAVVRSGSESSIVIPGSIKYSEEWYTVTAIGWEAFWNRKDLNSISLPSTIVAIGDRAFAGCTSLTSVNIPSSVKTIQHAAFAGCTSLGNVVLPNNIKLEDGAFANCTSLTSVAIPANAELGHRVFEGCTSLKSVEIPSHILSLGEAIFSECTGLVSAKVDYPTTGKWTFVSCTSLSTVTLTEKVKTIDTDAFHKCSSLTSVSMTNKLDSIKENSFQECTSLAEFTIPDNVVHLGTAVFSGCTNLKDVVIGIKVSEINQYTFSGCTALESLTIKGHPVYDCYFGETSKRYPNFSKLIIHDLTAWYSANFRDDEYNPLYSARHLYSDENTEITDLVIPDDITKISKYCFVNCQSFKSVTIPKKVEIVDDCAFAGCSNLVSAKICGSPTFGSSCFQECPNLSKIIIPDIKEWCRATITWSSPTSTAKHIYSDEETEITELVIPEGTESINPKVFSSCISLTSVKLPNSLSAVKDYAFQYCTNLSQLIVGSGLRSISETAFDNCKNIKKLVIPDIASWCSNVITGRTYICKNKTLYSDEDTPIKELVIPEGVEHVSYDAFYYCRGFTSVSFPSSLKSIGNYAFYYCTDLLSVKMNEGLETIGTYVYEGCGIRSVTIPSTVTSIGRNTFGLSNLSSVKVKNREPIAIESYVFPYKKTRSEAKLYVPYGTKELYKAAEVWKDFKRIYEMEPEAVTGDANGDGKVDIVDVTMTISQILGQNPTGFNQTAADVNGDGKVDIVDVTSIIDIILKAK